MRAEVLFAFGVIFGSFVLLVLEEFVRQLCIMKFNISWYKYKEWRAWSWARFSLIREVMLPTWIAMTIVSALLLWLASAE